MKNFNYIFFRAITYLVLFFTFRRRKAFNVEKLSKTDPIIFVGNHQNGLLDAIQIPTTFKRSVYFITRADVFKNPIVGKFLRSLHLLPIYRLRDGRDKLALNAGILDHCADLLVQGETLQMFPEGNHNPQRYLRSFKNGFADVAFMTLAKQPDLPLKIVPVGLNYNTGHGYPATITIIYGDPIPAKDYYDPADLKGSIARLKGAVLAQMQTLTTNIPEEEYDELATKLEDEGIDFLNPKEANQLIQSRNFTGGKRIDRSFSIWDKFIYFLFTANSLPPLLLWWKNKKGIKDLAFINTFRFVFVWVVFPIYYLIVAGVIAYFLGWDFGLWYLVFSVLLGYLRKRLPYRV